MGRGVSVLVAVLLGFAVPACTGIDPGMFRSGQAAKPGTVDSREAASLISAYRRQHGLGGVSVDPALTRIAANHSRRMAEANKMAHVLPGQGSFTQKLRSGGYNPGTAAENVAAGQKTLDDVLAAWKRSPGHNRNLLMSGVTSIGVAVAVSPDSRYKTFWTLILATPRHEGVAQMPNAGPIVSTTIAIGGGVVGGN
jgi:uncharacterized protein YkwD